VTAPATERSFPATEAFRRFGERLLLPGGIGYDAARRVWNGSVDHRPAALIRCADTADVADVVRLAREAGLPLSVRGGGHQVAGAAVVEGGVVADLSGLRFADVDRENGTVDVGGGALLSDLDRACARYEVAVPAGVVSHTGVGGLALGGGIGWLCRSRGLTCDSLLAATVVDARGEVLEASATEHPELFWALRGGGGNFGAVTRFVFRAAPIGPVVYGLRVVKLDDAAAVLARLHRIEDDLPRELQVVVKFQRFAGHDVDAGPSDEPVATIEWLWSGEPNRAEEAEKLMALGGGTVRRRRFASVQSQQDYRYPHGRHYYLKPGHVNHLDEATVSAMVDSMREAPPGDQQIEIMRLGGAVTDVDEMATAFPRRHARFAVNVSSGWEGDVASTADWARRTHALITRGGERSAYVNFVGAEGPALEDIYGAEKTAQLREVKRHYDPDGVFNAGVPITPAGNPRR
jgi:FAD/FMN-containing dehydrogenase